MKTILALLISIFFSAITQASDSIPMRITKTRLDYISNSEKPKYCLDKRIYYYNNGYSKTEVFQSDSVKLYTINDSINNPIEFYMKFDSVWFIEKYSYDKHNELSEIHLFRNNSLVNITYYINTYDTQSKLLSIEMPNNLYEFKYTPNGDTLESLKIDKKDSSRVVSKYQNNKIEKIQYLNRDNKLYDEEIYRYDINGRVIYRSWLNGWRIGKYYYDKNELLIKYEDWGGNEKSLLLSYTEYKYNSKGEKIFENHYLSNGELVYTKKSIYK